jgi:hypothetical protein
VTAPTPLGLAYVRALQAHHGVDTLAALADALGIGAPALSVRIRGTTPGHVGAMVCGLLGAGHGVRIDGGEVTVEPPLGPTPHAWTASGLPVTIEHTGVMWSCRVHLPEDHPWHDDCPHSVDGVYSGWACRAAYPQQGHDAARATEADAVACAAMLAAEARAALA